MREQDVIVNVKDSGQEGRERPARVVEVLDPFRVVIDWGRNMAVELGDEFEVYRLQESQPPRTGDAPETSPELIKGIGEVMAVYKKTAALRSITPAFIVERRTAIPGYLGGPFPEVVGEDSGEIAPFEDPRVGDLARPVE